MGSPLPQKKSLIKSTIWPENFLLAKYFFLLSYVQIFYSGLLNYTP